MKERQYIKCQATSRSGTSFDTVLLCNHYWENYNLIFDNSYGVKVATFELFANGGFNVADFGKQLNAIQGDKIITLLNFSNNPAGYTPLVSEIEGIVSEIKKVADKGKKVVENIYSACKDLAK